jgi:hypothetical protein
MGMITQGKVLAPEYGRKESDGNEYRASRKIGPGVALGPIYSSCCSGSRWSARAELEFFEVPYNFDTNVRKLKHIPYRPLNEYLKNHGCE